MSGWDADEANVPRTSMPPKKRPKVSLGDTDSGTAPELRDPTTEKHAPAQRERIYGDGRDSGTHDSTSGLRLVGRWSSRIRHKPRSAVRGPGNAGPGNAGAGTRTRSLPRLMASAPKALDLSAWAGEADTALVQSRQTTATGRQRPAVSSEAGHASDQFIVENPRQPCATQTS